MPADELTCSDCGGEFDDVDEVFDHDCDGRDDDPQSGGAAPLIADGGTDLTRWYEGLTAFQRDCLRMIRKLDAGPEESYGLAIKGELEDSYGTEVNHGRLYPNLDDLVNKGLVEKSELDKRTNEYTLTDEGSALVSLALAEDADLLQLAGDASAAPARTDGGHEGVTPDGNS